MTDIKKQGVTVPISDELLFITHDAERWPRRGHVVVHPITPEIRAAYKAYAKRWKAMEKARADLIAEGEKKRWARDDGGYEWEPAELLPLEPRREFVPEETREEHSDRVRSIKAHHRQTGEWLEEPQPTTMERIMQMSFGFKG